MAAEGKNQYDNAWRKHNIYHLGLTHCKLILFRTCIIFTMYLRIQNLYEGKAHA